MYFALTKKPLYRSTLSIFIAVLFFSCQKEFSFDNSGNTTPPDLTTRISSSVSGFVTDENNAAVMGATVQFGSSTTTTDKYGYFEAKNVQVVKEAAVVTVSKPGYFKGIKTYIATVGKAAFFRIKLIPKTIAGTIDAASGGTITLANGLNIKLPAGGIVNAATNTAYTGTVNVAAYWINPTAVDLNSIMPGDLRGIDKDGFLKLLQTFGMAAIELTGTSGELLQVATGKNATITLPIPPSLSATAPASIPLWYFDEAKGLWKEEGSAVKTGNSYVGDVSHFSFWNWDVPGNYVQFDCTIKDGAGNPIPFVLVQITVTGTYNSRIGYTNLSGDVSGLIPANAQLTLEVFPYYNCSPSIHTQTFTTTNANISLGVITISANYTALVSGTATDCNNSPVTNGYIIIITNNQNYWYALSNTGAFSFSRILCGNNNSAVTLVAEDLTAMQQSNPYNTNLVVGPNVVGNLQACNNSIAEFMNYSINGTNYSYTEPVDSVTLYGTPAILSVNASPIGSTNTNSSLIFDGAGIALNSSQHLSYFNASQFSNGAYSQNNINVLITEYGAIGEFISGNFSGTFIEYSPPNTVYNVTCSFRVRRTF